MDKAAEVQQQGAQAVIGQGASGGIEDPEAQQLAVLGTEPTRYRPSRSSGMMRGASAAARSSMPAKGEMNRSACQMPRP